MPSLPKDDFYDLHLNKTIAELDHQFMKKADIFIYVPINKMAQ